MIVALSNNQLSSLPDGIFEGIFEEPPDLTGTEIFGVPLGPISEDQLAELGDYTTVNLTGNLVDPLPLTVSLERVANGQFKAVAPAGAPFKLVLPIRVANGSINGGAESITIPVGSVESDTFTVTRTPGTTFSVSVDIETLPALPQKHTGYTLVKSADLPLVFTEFGGILSVSERTPEVRDAIVDAIPGVNSAADVTEAHLAAITRIQFALGNSVKAGDFDGLTGLTEFGLFTGQLTSIPAGLFNDLSNVTLLEFISDGLTTLPVGTFDSFTNLTSMTLYMPQLASLPTGVFDNLTNLTEFELVMSQLTSLPDGIFDQLTDLTGLSFHTGQLTSLPDNLFNQLTNLTGLSLSGSHLTSLLDSIKWPTTLTSLGLYSTQLSTLPDGVFAGLPSLTTLILNNNNLTSLPPDIFSELPNLTRLYIRDNQLSTLPDGLFFGLSSLTTLRLSGNSVDPLPLTVSLEKVGTGRFKAGAPTGAPFDIVVPISVTNGSITGGATSITIPTGSVESDTLTVTRTPDTTAAVTVDIGSLPGLPSDMQSSGNKLHQGYELAKSTDLPLAFPELGGSVFVPVSERTPQVRDAIVAAIPGVNSAADVTEEHLATITYLRFDPITSLKSGDLDGLSALTYINIDRSEGLTISEGAFSNLPALTYINIDRSEGLTISEGAFSNLPALTYINIDRSDRATISEGAFSNLPALTTFTISRSEGVTISEGAFSNLPALTTLDLFGCDFTALPEDIFNEFSSLTTLEFTYNPNELTTLPDGIFEGLTLLTRLWILPHDVDSTNRIPVGPITYMPLTVSLEKVAEGQFKAVAPTGAPFDIVLPISVTNGSITGGSTTITIPVGSIESETLTVIRTPGSTYATTIHIGPLPSLPQNHSGYSLVKSDDLPITMIEGDIPDTSVLTLTVGAGPGAALRGYNQHSAPEWDFGSFSPQSFELNGVSYTMYKLTYNVAGKRLALQTIPHLPGGFALHLDAQQFTSVTALDYNQYTWNNVELDWSDGKTVQIGFITTPPMPPGPPTNLQATPGYEKVTLSWIPPANADAIVLPITEYEYRISVDGGNTWDPDWETIGLGRTGHNTLTSCTFGDRNNNRNVDNLIDINLTNGTSYTFEIRARGGDGYSEAARITVVPDGSTPVSQRTPQVRDAIVAAVPGVNSANDVTEAHLAAITDLNLTSLLRDDKVTTLKIGDFDGLTNLTQLNLGFNELRTLPSGIFDGLTNLTELYLSINELRTLPSGIFDKLTNLTHLGLHHNELRTLPSGIFDKLTNLTWLNLNNNNFSSLPSGVFEGLTNLTWLDLHENNFSLLPSGVFKGLTNLTELNLIDDPGSPFPLPVSLEKVAEGQFKAVAPTGAPFEIVLPIAVTNGSISGGTTSLTIPAGSVESGTLTVTRDPGTTDAVSVDIRSPLPELPSNHSGYELVKSNDLPLEVIGATTPQVTGINIPDPNLRAKIETALGKAPGDPITATEMATLTTLNAQDARITNLAGLETATNLTELQLWDNQITNLSSLAGLTNLIKLYLWGNNISDISHLSGLTSLTQLRLGENSISNISAVSSLRNLTYLSVKENAISDISAVAGLTNLTELLIGNNTISDIAPVANLTKLVWLDMPNNTISDISPVQNLTQLVELYFQNNTVSGLSPLVANTGLGTDDELDVRGNPLSYPSIYTHIPALQARGVFIDFDNRTPTTPLKISGDTQQGVPGTALAQPFIVEVQDGDNVAFAGVPVTFAVTAGGGTLSVTSATTDANGRAESTLTLGNTAGTNTVSVSVQGISQTATFTATAAATDIVSLSPISNRTSQVRVAIVEAVPGVNSAADVTEEHLAAITSLDLSSKNITSLQAGDFDGLTALTNLNLSGNGHSIRVPSGIFDKLTELTHLNLNRTGALWGWSGFFDKLTNLTHLYMHQSDLASYNFAGIFDKNTELTHLYLRTCFKKKHTPQRVNVYV